MDFKDIILQLSERAGKLKDSLQTEEATKTSLILPFIQALGYDFFNPYEVIPEFTCDIGTKKGEKIDYAIMKEGKPIIIIECKHCNQDLSIHEGQLLRYFHVSQSKFGLLTNGINYRFYTDLDTPNKLDEKPFLDINILDLKENQIEELKKFHKSYFDIGLILESASELKYTSELKNLFEKEFLSPTPEFVKHFARQIYDGIITAKVLEAFTEFTKKSLHNYINDKITERLKFAIEPQLKNDTIDETSTEVQPTVQDNKIVTTKEELEGFYIVLSILRQHIDSERVTYRDAQNYFTVLIDDNNRKLICRFYFNNSENMRIAFLDDDKKEVRYQITILDDIYKYSEQLVEAVKKYL